MVWKDTGEWGSLNDCTIGALKMCSRRYSVGESQFAVSTSDTEAGFSFILIAINVS